MKRFGVGETAISNASRPMKDKEAAVAAENGVEPSTIKLPRC